MKNEVRSPWLSVFDYLFILRPMLFYPGWSTMLAGYLIYTKFHYVYLVHLTPDVWILMGAFAILMGSAFILNQIRDAESDRINQKLFMISDSIVPKRIAVIEAVVLVAGGLIIGFVLDFLVGVMFMLFFIVTGILYNYRPAVLKDRPWGSLFANAAMGWLAFAAGWCAQNTLSFMLIIDSLPYLFFNTSLYLFTMLPDVTGDRKSNKKTLAVLYGTKKMIMAAFLLFLIGFSGAVLLVDKLALFFYMCTLPFFLISLISFKREAAVQATKYGILFFAVAICLRWPPYFLIMLAGFLFTKLYYRQRFDFNYPHFSA